MKFQELLKVIKKYKGEGEDYTHFWGEVGNHNSGEIFEKTETYEIHSPQLKKEGRGLVLKSSDMEDCEFYKVGREAEGKWYEYKKGDGDQPDKFTIKVITEEELAKRKKELKEIREKYEEDRKRFERDKEEFEQRRKNGEKPVKTNEPTIKKCAFCGKEIDPSQGIISIGQTGKEEGCLYFCATDKCLEKRAQQKENQENNNKKCCDNCGNSTGDKYGYFEYLIVDGKSHCNNCCEKLPKKSEIEQEKVKLNSLKSKLQNSSNAAEKEILKTKISESENRLRGMEDKENKKQNFKQNNEGHEKLLFGGAVVLSFVAILVSILIIKKAKKKK